MNTDLLNNFSSLISEEQIDCKKNEALKDFARGYREAAWRKLKALTQLLYNYCGTYKIDSLFVSATLELANISFVLGKGFSELIDILLNALKVAGQMGDLRSQALINLHLGRLLYFDGQRQTAMAPFITGKLQVEAIGDEDIKTQASEFIGLFYFLQGRFNKAIEYFETASQSFKYDNQLTFLNPSGPLLLSYCMAFVGEFHRAIGTLDYFRRLAEESKIKSISNTLRAALGIILVSIKKQKEAHYHLIEVLQQNRGSNNALASHFANVGLALHHYTEGRLQNASDLLEKTMLEGEKYGISRQYGSPIILEVLAGLNRKGFLSSSSFNYKSEYKRVMNEPNIHLRGVALRLEGRESIDRKEPHEITESLFLRSETCLENAGDPIQLGKTRVEIARLKLLNCDRQSAYEYAQKARKDFGGYIDTFFPDDLRPLIIPRADVRFGRDSRDEMVNLFAGFIQEFSPTPDFDRLLARIITATNRFFGAERGGIFWFDNKYPKKFGKLRAACNLSLADIHSEDFKYNFSFVYKAYKEQRPQVYRNRDHHTAPDNIKAVLCVPITIEGKNDGVLYHDNSYLGDCFDNLDIIHLSDMANWLNSYFEHFFEFQKKIVRRDNPYYGRLESSNKIRIITNNSSMLNLLQQADQIAASDSSVLLLGETGVGKELMASRIHEKSSRSEKPFVIIELSSIPENLVESELFGYEKGAFTGADRQKKGRIELSNRGTLFVDEIGEIPQSIQTKLLRTIQEKTIFRIGGNKAIHSDFRLITATNRDLAKEVDNGRFREDLFYRLNVIPINIPPLRDRTEDIILLAEHFLRKFSYKYNKRGLELNQEHVKRLKAHHWPGNIRELQNIIERSVLLASENELSISFSTLNRSIQGADNSDMPTLDEMQRRYIIKIISYAGGKISGPGGAAELLGLKRTTLLNRMKKLGIK
jgi:transcriptional regulator with GAF, ATPase, and Fis domain